jgi:hypothetical protein
VECRIKAEECRVLAVKAETVQQRTMIEHIAAVWLSIASEIESNR